MLDKSGAFYPYGMAVALDGATRMIASDPGQGEHPPSTDVIATMLEGWYYYLENHLRFPFKARCTPFLSPQATRHYAVSFTHKCSK
jgi:hypothetical protein